MAAPEMEKTDEDIARLVQQGDGERFGVLVERYEAKISRYAKKFLFDTEDSKDLIQEIFLKAYINIQSFDISRRFSPWIYRIAHNEFINAGKKRSRTPVFSFDFDLLFPHPAASETADAETNRRDMRQILDQSLEKLGPKYREPLVLYYYEEMDYQEIAEILQIPVATLGVRLRRGRAMLQKIMTQQLTFDH